MHSFNISSIKISRYFLLCTKKLVFGPRRSSRCCCRLAAVAVAVVAGGLQAIYLIKSRTRQKPSKKRLKRARFLHNCCRNWSPLCHPLILSPGEYYSPFFPILLLSCPPFTCNCLSLNNVVSLLFSLSVLFFLFLFLVLFFGRTF